MLMVAGIVYGATWTDYTDDTDVSVGDTFLFWDIDAAAPNLKEITFANLLAALLADITEGQYPDSMIVGADIKDDTVDSADYAAGSIDAEHLADDSYKIVTKVATAAYTIGTTDSTEAYGGVIYVTSAAVITAPALVAGQSWTVITIGAIAVSMKASANNLIILDGVTLNDGDKATNTSTTGDIIVCSYYDATGWACMSGSPDGDKWTDTGA
jgi:hypothetical protein